LAFASSFDIRLQGGVGQRVERPSAISGPVTYRLSVGQLTIDLRHTTWSGSATVTASVGIGQLVIQVPSDVALVVRGRAGAGDVTVLGVNESGLDVDQRIAPTGLVPNQRGTLSMDLSVGLGQIQVTR